MPRRSETYKRRRQERRLRVLLAERARKRNWIIKPREGDRA